MNDAIALMQSYLDNPNYESRQSLRNLLRDIDGVQGDDYRNFRWTTVRFVRSGGLLKLEYALRCFVETGFSYWAYNNTSDSFISN